LCSSFRKEEYGVSWASELADTALALRALKRLSRERDGIIDDGFAWIASKQLPDGSFDGEPWDSLYVTLAGLDVGRLDLVIPTLEWLTLNQSESGALISNHYTGLYCEALARALEQKSLPSSLYQRVKDAARKALGFLWNTYDPKKLWGGTTWTNALVVQGMLALHHPQLLSKYDEILDWYAQRQSFAGAWEDTVRTAMVVEALWNLQLGNDIERCYTRKLETLTVEFVVRSTEQQLIDAVRERTIKAPLVAGMKFIERDSEGNITIALTRERQLYFAVATFVGSVLWTLITNWSRLRPFIFR
jgi:hypothetical protein